MIDGRIVKNFSLTEMMNNQADDDVKLVITPELVEHAFMMQELREWAVLTYSKSFKQGLRVSSWYRTKKFNARKDVGGHANSCHLQGQATDINNIPEHLYYDFVTAWQVICSIHKKIGGVEIYKWGMHFDSDSGRYGNKAFRLRDNR